MAQPISKDSNIHSHCHEIFKSLIWEYVLNMAVQGIIYICKCFQLVDIGTLQKKLQEMFDDKF
jgi:hypothetical protein